MGSICSICNFSNSIGKLRKGFKMIDSNNFISKLKNRDSNALSYVLDTYGNLIYKIAYMNLNSKELSEECVNDVLFKVWTSIDSFKYEDSKFKNWIAAIAKYTSIDILRREKKHSNNNLLNENISTNTSLEELIVNRDELLYLKQYVNETFNNLDKSIFNEKFINDNSINKIANKHKMTINSINLRIMRMRKKLNKLKNPL